MKKIALKHGWTDLGEQKMKIMLSFTKGKIRMNIYTTTNTVTFQTITQGHRWNKDGAIVHSNVREGDLDKILEKYD